MTKSLHIGQFTSCNLYIYFLQNSNSSMATILTRLYLTKRLSLFMTLSQLRFWIWMLKHKNSSSNIMRNATSILPTKVCQAAFCYRWLAEQYLGLNTEECICHTRIQFAHGPDGRMRAQIKSEIEWSTRGLGWVRYRRKQWWLWWRRERNWVASRGVEEIDAILDWY